jgi:hypothetical protein
MRHTGTRTLVIRINGRVLNWGYSRTGSSTETKIKICQYFFVSNRVLAFCSESAFDWEPRSRIIICLKTHDPDPHKVNADLKYWYGFIYYFITGMFFFLNRMDRYGTSNHRK